MNRNDMKNFWDTRYDRETYSYGIDPNDFLVHHLDYLKPKGKILCLSEGEGRNAIYLAKKGFLVEAVDFSVQAQKKAMSLAKENNVNITYHVADLNDFELGENEWDAVISISAHLDSRLRNRLHTKIRKGLKQDGIFLLEGYNKDQINNDTGGPKDVDMLFSLEELHHDFNGFNILHSKDLIRDVTEGDCHGGLAAVSQFIAKK